MPHIICLAEKSIDDLPVLEDAVRVIEIGLRNYRRQLSVKEFYASQISDLKPIPVDTIESCDESWITEADHVWTQTNYRAIFLV